MLDVMAAQRHIWPLTIGLVLNTVSRTFSARQDTILLSPPPQRANLQSNVLPHLAPATRCSLLAIGRFRDYRSGELVFRQGDLHDGIHLVETGMIKSFYVSEDGRELTLGYWTAGHYVGAPQMFGGGQHAWTSVAATTTRCLWLPGAKLRDLSSRHSDLALALIDALTHKTECYCALLQLLATHSMRARLARLLEKLVASEANGPKIIDLSHSELASMIGSTRQWVSLSLTRFEDKGLVRRRPDGTYVVIDETALRSVC